MITPFGSAGADQLHSMVSNVAGLRVRSPIGPGMSSRVLPVVVLAGPSPALVRATT